MAGPYDRITRLYIGYDASEHRAFQVAKYTALKHTPGLTVIPVVQDWLRANDVYNRQRDQQASNDFSMTRWLTPHLAGYQGIALFTDCDMVFTRDLNEMLRPIDNFKSKACYVVKHKYTPKTNIKMDGQVQHVYPCKNWSSVVLWNCEHPVVKRLTPEMVNSAPPSDLHQFKWLDHGLIGELSPTWNFLVGEYDKPETTPAVLHYTLGVPSIHDELFTKDYVDEFEKEYCEILEQNYYRRTTHSSR